MKIFAYIFVILYLIQATFANPNPEPGVIDTVGRFFGFGGTPYTDNALAIVEQIKQNVTDIFAELQSELKGNSSNYLSGISSLFNSFDDLCQCSLNSTFNIFDKNQTASLAKKLCGYLQVPQSLSLVCGNSSLLSSSINLVNQKICKDAPSFSDIAIRAQNLTEELVNNTIRGYMCTFTRFFGNQLVQSIDFTGISKYISSPNLKDELITTSAIIDRCLFEFITDIKLNQTSSKDCENPIASFKNKINDYLSGKLKARSGVDSSTDEDILNALLIHLNQMTETIGSVLSAKNEYVKSTDATTKQASNTLLNNLLNYFTGQTSSSNSLQLSNSTQNLLNSISTSLQNCFKCALAEIIELFNYALDWGRVILDLKRAEFCGVINFIDKIKNMTCDSFNSTNSLVSATTSSLSSQISMFKNNIFCFQNDFRSSFFTSILSSILNFFALCISGITNGIASMIDTISDISLNTAITSTSSLVKVLNNFDINCINGNDLIDPLNQALQRDVNSCRLNDSYVTDLCKKGFSFSFWDPIGSIKNNWNVFNSTLSQFSNAAENFNQCIYNKHSTAASTLMTILSICN